MFLMISSSLLGWSSLCSFHDCVDKHATIHRPKEAKQQRGPIGVYWISLKGGYIRKYVKLV